MASRYKQSDWVIDVPKMVDKDLKTLTKVVERDSSFSFIRTREPFSPSQKTLSSLEGERLEIFREQQQAILKISVLKKLLQTTLF
jgi:hypothetical protein